MPSRRRSSSSNALNSNPNADNNRLVNGLKLSTEDFQPVTAFQVSTKGMQFVSQLTADLMIEVDSFLYAPDIRPRELLAVRFCPGKTEQKPEGEW